MKSDIELWSEELGLLGLIKRRGIDVKYVETWTEKQGVSVIVCALTFTDVLPRLYL